MLYQIISSAEQHSNVETLPFRAIFAAYDKVLAQHGINPIHDQIYLRFLFRLGDRKQPGHSLYECFEAVLEECGIRIEIDSNDDRVPELTVDVDLAKIEEAETHESAIAWAATSTPRRPRRASFEAFYDAAEDSIRPIQPFARSQAPTLLSQANGFSAPVQRPSTRATTRSTEKTQKWRLHDRSIGAPANGESLIAKDLAIGSCTLHPSSARKNTKTPIGKTSPASRYGQYKPSSSAETSPKVSAPNGDNVQLQEAYQPMYSVDRDALLYQPSETQLIRDVDTFQQFSIRRVARATLQKWCASAFQAKVQHQSMRQEANSHDLETLLRQGFQQWRTIFHEKMKAVETRRFFEKLERKASKARDLYLLTKAFTHWAQSASDHVDRTSVVRRNLLGLKYFNAWYEITIVNELKVRQYQLSRYLQIWRRNYTRTQTSESQAVIMYSECLVKAAYWRWFWTFCEKRAPEWRAGKLKKNIFSQWASRQQGLSRKHQLVTDLRRETIARWSFSKWAKSSRTTRMRLLEVFLVNRQKCLGHALGVWKMHWQHRPRAQQISNMVDWRVAGTTFATIITRHRVGRQARIVNRMRIMRNAWTDWNDALRQIYLVKMIDDRIVTEQLYRWALAQRCGLAHRSCERRLKHRVLHKLATVFSERKDQREMAFRRVCEIVNSNMLRLIISHWNSQIMATRRRQQLALEYHAPRIAQEALQAWSARAVHLQSLSRDAGKAAFYLPASKTFKRWQSATIESKRGKRRTVYIQVRKDLKMRLAARILRQWQDLTNERSQFYEHAQLSDQGRLLRCGAILFDQWRARTEFVEMHNEKATQHYTMTVAGQYLQHWFDRCRAQWRMEDLAGLNDAMRVSNISFGWLHRLRLRAIEVQGREANAQSLRRFYEKRHCQGMLRRWREMAAKKPHRRRREPSPVNSILRDMSSGANPSSLINPRHADRSLGSHPVFDPGEFLATIEANTSAQPLSFLSTPSKRATRARELVGMSETPAGTPFRARLKSSLATTPYSQRPRELGKSTNLRSNAFGAIFENSPRTPGA